MYLNEFNAIASFAIGLPVNLLICWLIRCRTNQSLRVWSLLLLQASFIDMGLLTIGLLDESLWFGTSDGLYVRIDGPAALFNDDVKYYVHMILGVWQYFAKHAIVVQFAYRWLVICRDKILSTKCYALLLVLAFMVSLLKIAVLFWDRTLHCPELCNKRAGLIFVTSTGTDSIRITTLVWIFSEAVTILLTLLFNILCWLKTRSGLLEQQERSRKINRQVTIVLLLQALYPLLLSNLPTLSIMTVVNMGMEIPEWMSLLQTQNWHAIVYPLFTILIIGHYRKCFAKMIGFNKTIVVTSAAVVQPMNQKNLQRNGHQRI